MAVVDLKSGSITNFDASPRVAEDAGKGAPARLLMVDDFVTTANGDSIDSIYRMVRVPSTAKIKKVRIEHVALGAGCLTDVGVFYANSVGEIGAGKTAGAVIDRDFFASAYDAAAASVSGGVDVTNESGNYTLNEREMPLWEAVGLTSDPGGKFDICLQLTAATAAAGRVGLKVEYAE